MTRKEQIEEAANIEFEKYDKTAPHAFFIAGAEWADSTNPAGKWESDHQKIKLEEAGLAEEFPYGCDAIEHVAQALIHTRKMLAIAEEALKSYLPFNTGKRAEEALAKISELKK